MTWVDIGAVDDIPVRGARKVRTRIGCIAVFRTGESEVFAAQGGCPHRDGPLAEGIVHGSRVTCPLHNWVFDLRTGRAVGEDARITTYPVRIAEGRILIEGTALAGRSAA